MKTGVTDSSIILEQTYCPTWCRDPEECQLQNCSLEDSNTHQTVSLKRSHEMQNKYEGMKEYCLVIYNGVSPSRNNSDTL